MKYMTFNNSCSFAGVANMLEDFLIDSGQLTIDNVSVYLIILQMCDRCSR